MKAIWVTGFLLLFASPIAIYSLESQNYKLIDTVEKIVLVCGIVTFSLALFSMSRFRRNHPN